MSFLVIEHPRSPKVMTGHICCDIVLVSSLPAKEYPTIKRVMASAILSTFTHCRAISSSDLEVFNRSVKAEITAFSDSTVTLFILKIDSYNRNDELMRNSEGYFRGNALCL